MWISFFLSQYRTLVEVVSNALKTQIQWIMSKKNNRFSQICARIGRVERKCNRLIAEVTALREALMPRRSEIDEVIGHLHRTATALREQSRSQRLYYSRILREE